MIYGQTGRGCKDIFFKHLNHSIGQIYYIYLVTLVHSHEPSHIKKKYREEKKRKKRKRKRKIKGWNQTMSEITFILAARLASLVCKLDTRLKGPNNTMWDFPLDVWRKVCDINDWRPVAFKRSYTESLHNSCVVSMWKGNNLSGGTWKLKTERGQGLNPEEHHYQN